MSAAQLILKRKVVPKSALLLIVLLFVSACAQMSTNERERDELQQSAVNVGDSYIACVKAKAAEYASGSNSDASMAFQVASGSCQQELDAYKTAQNSYLSSKQMLTSKPLEESVDALNDRAETELAEEWLKNPATTSAVPAASAAAVSAGVAVESGATNGDWNTDQRIYLDCMEDQADKYIALDESATAIAEVAQDRCKSYLEPGSGTSALEQEGRALVMGAVMDARLEQPAGSGN